jgi:hypothetical protein
MAVVAVGIIGEITDCGASVTGDAQEKRAGDAANAAMSWLIR